MKNERLSETARELASLKKVRVAHAAGIWGSKKDNPGKEGMLRVRNCGGAHGGRKLNLHTFY